MLLITFLLTTIISLDESWIILHIPISITFFEWEFLKAYGWGKMRTIIVTVHFDFKWIQTSTRWFEFSAKIKNTEKWNSQFETSHRIMMEKTCEHSWPFVIEFNSTMKEPRREYMWCIQWTVHSSFYSFWVCTHVYLSNYDIFNEDEILFVWYAFF